MSPASSSSTADPHQSPLISFVIPNYNYGEYLGECIDRCLAQEIDAEVLVMDGGSTDSTLEVLKSYGDRIRWVSEPDKGQSEALNKGVRQARGRYIAWINSDDYYAEGRPLQRIVEVITEYPDVDIVYGDVRYVKESGELYRERKSPAQLSARLAYVSPYETIVQPELIFRRQLFLDVGGVDLGLHFSMDLDLWMRMLTRTEQIRYVPVTVACARVHERAKTRSQIRNSIRESRQVRRQYRELIPLTLGDRLKAMTMQAKVELYWMLVRLGFHQVPE